MMTKNVLILKNRASYYSHLSPPKSGSSYAFLLDANEQDLKNGYQQISTFKISFAIALNVSAAMTDHLIYQVISFLFLPYYQNKAIYILTDEDALFEITQNRIKELCALQSMEINVIHVNEPAANAEDLQNKKSGSFFMCDCLDDVKEAMNENKIDDTDNDANEFELLRSENILQRKKVELLTAELEMQKTYNEKLRSSHQAKEIQSYYDKEYELLPGWYKKIGGFIKWMMKKKQRD